MTTDATTPKITALAPWFGGKRTLAADIVREIGKHSVYWEPFCGSMAVLLAKPPCRQETVNDLNRDLVNLATVLRGETTGPKLYRRLRRYLASRGDLQAARERLTSIPLIAMPDIDRAEAYFVNSWLSMNGTAGTSGGIEGNRGFARRFTSGGGSPQVRFHGAIESIPAWRRRLRSVFVENGCGIEICERIEDLAGVVIYADPPYLRKGTAYLHDFTPSDHERLAKALRRFKKTRVVVSYYDEPELDNWYHGWTKVRLKATKALVNQGMRDAKGSTEAPEVLLINGPSFAPEAARSLF